MTESNQLAIIRQKLEQAFPGADIQLSSTGSMHRGHGSCGLHLKTEIAYNGFAGKDLLHQHRMVHRALQQEMDGEIHAISIHTREVK